MSGLPPSSAHGPSRVRPFLFKTRLCPSFMMTAGSATPSHGSAEPTSPLPQQDNVNGSSSGCRFGAACSFAHGPDELRTTKQNIAERVTSENGLHAYRRRARAAARGGRRNASGQAPPAVAVGSPFVQEEGIDVPWPPAGKSREASSSSLEPLSRPASHSVEEAPAAGAGPLPNINKTPANADAGDARQLHPVSPLVNEPPASTSAASSTSLGSAAPPQHPRRSSALLAAQTAPSVGAHGDRYPFQHDPYRPVKRSPPAAGSGHDTPVMASRAEHAGFSAPT